MCTDPKIFNGYEASCRECDECVATYKNTWVARCVAEKRTLPHAYALTLTYADVAGEPPLGARVYRYKDVQDFWKRIRFHGNKKWGKDFELRYVIVGEKGTLKGRCHYHGVVFSNYPIHEIGKLTSAKGGGFAYKRRLDWTTWGHGYVEFQPADRKGMAYVLKYILKARMTSARSEGYGREGKTEWLASSYLWCSKRPAVGAAWLFEKLDDMISKGISPPSLRVRVPGGGDWYVRGELQKDMCLYLREANQQYNAQRGRDLAGWSELIRSVEEEIELVDTGELVKRKPWEWLINGDEEDEEDEYTQVGAALRASVQLDNWEEEWQQRNDTTLFRYRHAQKVVERCANIKPCKACAARRSQRDRDNAQLEYNFELDAWAERQPPIRDGDVRWAHRQFQRQWRERYEPSRYCLNREGVGEKQAFDLLRRLKQARPPKGLQTTSR